jgi:hypothetical protein
MGKQFRMSQANKAKYKADLDRLNFLDMFNLASISLLIPSSFKQGCQQETDSNQRQNRSRTGFVRITFI